MQTDFPAYPPYFNPRSPWGERLFITRIFSMVNEISIHAPRGGSDVGGVETLFKQSAFQSTLPVGGATLWRWSILRINIISIHAPRGGSDATLNS